MAQPPLLDVAGNLTSTAGVSADGKWVYLWTFAQSGPNKGDYDLLWMPMIKIPSAPLAAWVDTLRKGVRKNTWIWIGAGGTGSPDPTALGQAMDLSCAEIRPDTGNAYNFFMVCRTSTLEVGVGLPGSPSPFITSILYRDSTHPVTKATSPTAPGIADRLNNLAVRALGVTDMLAKS